MADSHLCPVRLGAGQLISSHWCFDEFASVLAQLPVQLSEQDVSRRELLLYSDERRQLDIYYAPLDWVNRSARIVVVGITPGRRQAVIALRTASEAIAAGLTDIEGIQRQAKGKAAFAGAMRTNLVAMLDGIGLAERLGLRSTTELWGDAGHLLNSTSAIIYPTLIAGRDYSGNFPRMLDVPILTAFVDQVLRCTIDLLPNALVVPLGKRVEETMLRLGLDESRYLRGFPHPSPANGWRVTTYQHNRESLTSSVARWFS